MISTSSQHIIFVASFWSPSLCLSHSCSSRHRLASKESNVWAKRGQWEKWLNAALIMGVQEEQKRPSRLESPFERQQESVDGKSRSVSVDKNGPMLDTEPSADEGDRTKCRLPLWLISFVALILDGRRLFRTKYGLSDMVGGRRKGRRLW